MPCPWRPAGPLPEAPTLPLGFLISQLPTPMLPGSPDKILRPSNNVFNSLWLISLRVGHHHPTPHPRDPAKPVLSPHLAVIHSMNATKCCPPPAPSLCCRACSKSFRFCCKAEQGSPTSTPGFSLLLSLTRPCPIQNLPRKTERYRNVER